MNICVYGSSSDEIDEIYIKKTEALGRLISDRGYDLVFGAGAKGLMGAAARGVSENKRTNIYGIVPSFFNVDGILFDGCDEIIYTDGMRDRKSILQHMSDGYIITPGGVGTLDEFFEIFTLRKLGRIDKPIAVFNIKGYYDELIDFIKKMVDDKFLDQATFDSLFISDDEEKIIEYIENY